MPARRLALARGAVALLLAAVLAGAAEARSCVARVNRQELIIVPAAMAAPTPGPGERLLMWPSRTWDRAWGQRSSCDSATITAFLARTMRLDQTQGYCLAEDEAEGFLLVPGAAGLRGRCKATACDRVNATAGVAAEVGLAIAGLAAGRPIEDAGDGVAAVAHGTGAMLVTGQASAIVASLGQTAGTVGAAVAAAPVAAGAAAVTVVAAGGAVYLCAE